MGIQVSFTPSLRHGGGLAAGLLRLLLLLRLRLLLLLLRLLLLGLLLAVLGIIILHNSQAVFLQAR